MVRAESYRLSIVGVCLLVIGGGLLPPVLASPPELYAYSAERLDGESKLSPSVLDTATRRKSSVTGLGNVDEFGRETFRNAVSNNGNWTPTNSDLTDSSDSGYVVYRGDVYEVAERATPPAIRVTEVRGEERLEVLAIDITEFHGQDYFDVRITDTQYEVIERTINGKEHSSFTSANVDNVVIRYEGEFYRFTSESRQSTNVVVWLFSVVFLSLSLFCGIALLAYPVVRHAIRLVD